MLLRDIVSFIRQMQKEKAKKAFLWADTSLEQYISWAFSRNYLFFESDENGLTGIGICYLLPTPCDGTVYSMLPSDAIIEKNEEASKEMCLMDIIFKTKSARTAILKRMMQRFPNWENQTKWACRKGKIIKIPNHYAKLSIKI